MSPAAGAYTFSGDSDGALRLWLDGAPVFDKGDNRRREVRGEMSLRDKQVCDIKVEYVHRQGLASAHVHWSGPGIRKQVLQLKDR